MLFKIGTRLAGQSLMFCLGLAAKNPAGLMDFRPGGKWNIKRARNWRGGMGGALHQAAIQMGQAKAVAVVNVPARAVWLKMKSLVLLQEICQQTRLLNPVIGQARIRTFLIILVAPIGVVL